MVFVLVAGLAGLVLGGIAGGLPFGFSGAIWGAALGMGAGVGLGLILSRFMRPAAKAPEPGALDEGFVTRPKKP